MGVAGLASSVALTFVADAVACDPVAVATAGRAGGDDAGRGLAEAEAGAGASGVARSVAEACDGTGAAGAVSEP